MYYLLAIFSGFTNIFSVTQNSSLSNKIGLKSTALLNYLTGISVSFIFFIALGNFNDFYGLKNMSPLAYAGGLLGLITVFLCSYIFRNISIIIASMLIFTGQIISSFVIDYFRGIALSPMKIGGVALIMAGIYVNNYIDYRALKKT